MGVGSMLLPFLLRMGGVAHIPWETLLAAPGWVGDHNVHGRSRSREKERGSPMAWEEAAGKWRAGLPEQSTGTRNPGKPSPPHGLYIWEKITAWRSLCCLFAISTLFRRKDKAISRKRLLRRFPAVCLDQSGFDRL